MEKKRLRKRKYPPPLFFFFPFPCTTAVYLIKHMYLLVYQQSHFSSIVHQYYPQAYRAVTFPTLYPVYHIISISYTIKKVITNIWHYIRKNKQETKKRRGSLQNYNLSFRKANAFHLSTYFYIIREQQIRTFWGGGGGFPIYFKVFFCVY